MKTFILTILLAVTFSGYTQITRTTGEHSNEVISEVTEDNLILGYVASTDKIQTFTNFTHDGVFQVTSFTITGDALIYKVIDGNNDPFTITYKIELEVLHLEYPNGDYLEISGAGLRFDHKFKK